MSNLIINAPLRQGFEPQSNPTPLDLLIADLGRLRDGMIGTDRRRRTAILAGQLTLLLREYRIGRRPSRKTLRRFFYFVCREQAL